MILDEIVEDKKKRLTCHKKNVSQKSGERQRAWKKFHTAFSML